eukprot:TRINITY_DN67071_c1_g14_i2.p1 TRINITY_DN67071_c1_g14~~TRINITY_DN67071_c1_g14_i2.p1  ORF type:complete len:218 (-),score=26.38 TRINITY_DN67071_c1_g14_i2:197-850(-)
MTLPICAQKVDHEGRQLANVMYTFENTGGRLLIGGVFGLQDNASALKEIGVTHILNCTQEITPEVGWQPPNFEGYCQLVMDDNLATTIEDHWDKGVQFIKDALLDNKEKTVYVHCTQGRSRSVSVALAFMMQHTGNPNLQEWLELFNGRRHNIGPNPNFMCSLMDLEERLTGKPTTLANYRVIMPKVAVENWLKRKDEKWASYEKHKYAFVWGRAPK